MSKNPAWTLILTVIIVLGGVVGCASDKSRRSTRDSAYASDADNASSHAPCH